jgi:hypothetical protein
MFGDKFTTTHDAAEEVWHESKLLDDPPSSLVALLSWEEDDGSSPPCPCGTRRPTGARWQPTGCRSGRSPT